MMPKPVCRQSPANAHNYGSRASTPIDMIVLHTAEDVPDGSLAGVAAWFSDSDAQCSAHYGIDIAGKAWQFVDDSYAAWHAGNGLINRWSIGVELEGRCDDPGHTFTEPMYATLSALCGYLVSKYRIRVDRQHIIGHSEVPHPKLPGVFGGLHRHHDPGPAFPWWDRLIADLKGEHHA